MRLHLTFFFLSHKVRTMRARWFQEAFCKFYAVIFKKLPDFSNFTSLINEWNNCESFLILFKWKMILFWTVRVWPGFSFWTNSSRRKQFRVFSHMQILGFTMKWNVRRWRVFSDVLMKNSYTKWICWFLLSWIWLQTYFLNIIFKAWSFLDDRF